MPAAIPGVQALYRDRNRLCQFWNSVEPVQIQGAEASPLAVEQRQIYPVILVT